jgi:AraC family transcriptional regulator
MPPVGAVRQQSAGFPGATELLLEGAGAEFIESTYEQATFMSQHSHGDPSLHIVVRGHLTNRIEGRTDQSTTAQVAYVPADAPHETFWRNGGVGFAVVLRPEKVAEWLEWGVLPRHPVDLAPGLVSALLLAARRTCFAGDATGLTDADGYLAEALAEMMRLPGLTGEREGRSRRLYQARQILRDAFDTPPSLAEIARQVGMHPVYLARAFRKAFGETPGECIRRRRLDECCRLIARTRQPLGEIALSVGFADQAHFTRTFKQSIGVPPTQYARLMRPDKK